MCVPALSLTPIRTKGNKCGGDSYKLLKLIKNRRGGGGGVPPEMCDGPYGGSRLAVQIGRPDGRKRGGSLATAGYILFPRSVFVCVCCYVWLNNNNYIISLLLGKEMDCVTAHHSYSTCSNDDWTIFPPAGEKAVITRAIAMPPTRHPTR